MVFYPKNDAIFQLKCHLLADYFHRKCLYLHFSVLHPSDCAEESCRSAENLDVVHNEKGLLGKKTMQKMHLMMTMMTMTTTMMMMMMQLNLCFHVTWCVDGGAAMKNVESQKVSVETA